MLHLLTVVSTLSEKKGTKAGSYSLWYLHCHAI